jgi:hypothetical protein
MRHVRHGLCALCFLALSAELAMGQTPTAPATPAPPPTVDMMAPPAWLFNDLACAPFLTSQAPGPLRVLGSQDSIIKHMMGPGDTLVINGGSAAGLQPGQRFYVRRNITTFGAKPPDGQHTVSVHTAGWVQILGVDAGVATATVVGSCEGIMLDDYLEPFTPPMIAARVVPGATPQYADMGHILTGDEATENVAGAGQLTNIDRGSNHGIVAGQRFLVFRDKRALRNESPEYSQDFVGSTGRLPLVEVGEVLVIAVRPDSSTVQVVVSRDAIAMGDLIAEIR